jgi:bifunctional DNA-binding transcriptional regulator/antitoxin component of YhaV-PrlF toxin-antitoxin module
VTATELRETDDKGRVTLPKGFANATLLIERVSDVELVIRKAKVVPLSPGGSDEPFLEEQPILLSPEEQMAFFEALMNPPGPNEALKKLMSGPKLAKRKKS